MLKPCQLQSRQAWPRRGGGGGGLLPYSGFQVTGMIAGCFWVENFGKYFFG